MAQNKFKAGNNEGDEAKSQTYLELVCVAFQQDWQVEFFTLLFGIGTPNPLWRIVLHVPLEDDLDECQEATPGPFPGFIALFRLVLRIWVGLFVAADRSRHTTKASGHLVGPSLQAGRVVGVLNDGVH